MESDEGVWRDVEIVRSPEGAYDLRVDGQSIRAEERKAERERCLARIGCIENDLHPLTNAPYIIERIESAIRRSP
jgi:hypothetical protein